MTVTAWFENTGDLSTEIGMCVRFAIERTREVDAALCDSVGCVCLYLARLGDLEDELGEAHDPFLAALASIGVDYRTDPPTVTKHASCCGCALADAIREQE